MKRSVLSHQIVVIYRIHDRFSNYIPQRLQSFFRHLELPLRTLCVCARVDLTKRTNTTTVLVGKVLLLLVVFVCGVFATCKVART